MIETALYAEINWWGFLLLLAIILVANLIRKKLK